MNGSLINTNFIVGMVVAKDLPRQDQILTGLSAGQMGRASAVGIVGLKQVVDKRVEAESKLTDTTARLTDSTAKLTDATARADRAEKALAAAGLLIPPPIAAAPAAVVAAAPPAAAPPSAPPPAAAAPGAVAAAAPVPAPAPAGGGAAPDMAAIVMTLEKLVSSIIQKEKDQRKYNPEDLEEYFSKQGAKERRHRYIKVGVV